MATTAGATAEPRTEPTTEPTTEPMTEYTTEPTTEHTTGPTTEYTTEHATGPTTKPTSSEPSGATGISRAVGETTEPQAIDTTGPSGFSGHPTTAAPAIHKTAGGNAAFRNFHNDFAHITDPNERRRLALAEIDKAPFGWYHVRACVVAGIGFFTDSYDIFVVSLLVTMLGIVYWPGDPSDNTKKAGTTPLPQDTGIKVATSGGTVIGQLGFGALADVIGRKRMYGVELIIIIIATLGQSLCSPSPAVTITGVIIFWRVIMGIGIGGDYPLSSIITSEFATTKWRGAMMGAVFAMQGFGQLAGALVMLCLVAGFRDNLMIMGVGSCSGDCAIAVDKMWRILIGMGAVPACIALYFRLTIPETPRFTFDVARDVERAGVDVQAYMTGKHEGNPDEIRRIETMQASNQLTTLKASWRDFFKYYCKWKNGKILIGTAGSWFVLDVAFYGLGLNQSSVLAAINYAGDSKNSYVYDYLYSLAAGGAILVCAGAIPGYWCTVATIDTIGRRPIQMMGFVILTILFLIWGFDFPNLDNHAKFAIYVVAQFFFNFGPDATTFIVPGECFPTRYRSTSHGISAASGKLGSIIAQAAIAPLQFQGAPDKATGAAASPWLDNVMKIYAFFMLLGCFFTLLIPETKLMTLEVLAGEREDTASGLTNNPMVEKNAEIASDQDRAPPV